MHRTARSASIWILFGAIADVREVTAPVLEGLLTRARAWGDVGHALNIHEALLTYERTARTKLKISSLTWYNALWAGKEITSAPFSHLFGAAIGEGMKHARIARIQQTLNLAVV